MDESDRQNDQADSDEFAYRTYVRDAIQNGLKDSEARRVVDTETVRKTFGLPPIDR